MTNKSPIQELLDITSDYTGRTDQIQGPGGNTSVKTEDGIMYIKASGFRFEELNERNGISAVHFQPVAEFFQTVSETDRVRNENNMLKVIAEHTLSHPDGTPYPKPSMETGFHSVLGKYVVHTHSVWTNLVNCSQNYAELAEKLKNRLGFTLSTLPYVSPGFMLSNEVSNLLKNSIQTGKNVPDVILLANHGVIAHSNQIHKAGDYLAELDNTIRDLFNIEDGYPDTAIVETKDGWIPASDFVHDMLIKHQADAGFFDKVLFPDQMVFFKNQIGKPGEINKKINLDKHGYILYTGNEREIRSVHETLTAYLFIRNILSDRNQTCCFIGENEKEYIGNMEMEKHRKEMMKHKK